MISRPAISSMSLGRCYAGHSLNDKLKMAAKHGIQGIEIFFEDLADLARPQTPTNLLAAARYVHGLCTCFGLEIICLQPFMHYEGLLDRQKHAERIEEMKLWIQLAKELGTDTIAIPATFLSKQETSSDMTLIVSDLREVAELGLRQSPTIRFAYESLCWSTHINTWEQCWDVVQRVDRPNFGICLDTFNILGRIYADPASDTRLTPNAGQEVRDSIRRLVRDIGPHREKIFYLQIVDAERLDAPLRPGHPFYNAQQPARMSWSRSCRLFYGETEHGAHMPVKDLVQAIVDEIGYDGWFSMELFNRVMDSKDKDVVETLAKRAAVSWRKLATDLDLDVGMPAATSAHRVLPTFLDGTNESARL